MQTIPMITSDLTLYRLVKESLKVLNKEEIVIHQLENQESAIEYLTVEMPELVFIDFNDPGIDGFNLLEKMMNDTWLLHGGIIGICHKYNEIERLENNKGANLIIALDIDELIAFLPKMLLIISNNRRILFQRGISEDFLRIISGSFKLDNDPLEVKCYVNLICNFLYNSNRLKLEQKFNLRLALTEMLMNAIEHGNCEVGYDEKSQWLQNNLDISDLIAQKKTDPVVNQRKVTFEYALTEQKGSFLISDEGKGFDWRHIKDVTKAEHILELHGRGIIITRALVQNLIFNEKGNEVTFDIPFDLECEKLMPGLFESIPPKKIKAGDIIFNIEEPGDFLYYIVNGKYNVIVNDTIVSTLTPDDIFMGEMSFLLNHRRSASIKAETNGILIEISKKDFITAIRLKPHYALFLCRLLAQRIQRNNFRK